MNLLKRRSFVLILAIATTGCEGNRANITGTITRDGKPFVSLTEEGQLLVLFFPEPRTSSSQVYRAETNRHDGTFRIPEIRAGRYLVAIQQFDFKHNDALNGKYDPGKSPLRFDVTEDGQVIDIDLPK